MSPLPGNPLADAIHDVSDDTAAILNGFGALAFEQRTKNLIDLYTHADDELLGPDDWGIVRHQIMARLGLTN